MLDIGINVECEVHQHAIERNADERDAEEFPYLPFSYFEPIKVEQYAGVHAEKCPHILRLFGQFFQTDDFAVKYLLHCVFGAESKFGKESDNENENHIAVSEKAEFHIGIAIVVQAVEHECENHKSHTGGKANTQAVEPHVIVAIDCDVRQHQHEAAYQQRSLKVDSLQRKSARHRAERAAADNLCD